MPHRDCKSSYEVLTMGLMFAAVIVLVTTTTEAASAQIRVGAQTDDIFFVRGFEPLMRLHIQSREKWLVRGCEIFLPGPA